MRSDEERDKRIDGLITRVQALEDEIARLKGEPLTGASAPKQQRTDKGEPLNRASASEHRQTEQQQTDLEAFRPAVFAKPEQKIHSGKPVDSSLENAIGTRWIGRIGVLAILFGVAFFLKYSFDNKLIGETGRVILGIFWGALFLGAGEYLQKKKNMGLYGQMLSGGGLAVLYLALYAGFALYHLLPAPLAASGMLAVTTTGMTLSIRYAAYSLAAIALLGGFLTPVMLSTGQNQPLTLFGYVLLLDIGTLLLLRFRQWPSLAAASLLGTVLLYTGWHTEFYSDAQRWLAFGVIAVFFVFYNLYILISRLYPRNAESTEDQIIIFGSAAFFFLAFFSQYHWVSAWPVKTCALVLAGVELGLGQLVRRRAPASRMTIAAYTAASMIMTVIATFIVLENRWIMPALAAEMAALGWMSFRLELPALRRGAYLLGLLVLFRFAEELFLSLDPFQRFIPLFNGRFLVCGAAITGFYILLYFTARHRVKLAVSERYAPEMIFVVTQVLSLVLLSVEVRDFFHFRSPGRVLGWGTSHYAYQLSLSVLWALYASLLTGAGIWKRLRGARILGILLLGATVLKVFWVDLSALQTFYRIISFVVLGLLLLVVSYGYNRFRDFIFGDDKP